MLIFNWLSTAESAGLGAVMTELNSVSDLGSVIHAPYGNLIGVITMSKSGS